MTEKKEREAPLDDQVTAKKVKIEETDSLGNPEIADARDDLQWKLEESFGLIEFVGQKTEFPGFSGILKQRYSDFLVNEVDSDGTVLHLHEFKKPEKEVAAEEQEEEEEKPVAEEEMTMPPQEFWDQMGVHFDDVEVENLKNLIETGSYLVLARSRKIEDKQVRSEIHQLVKKHLSSKITSSSDNGCIVISMVGNSRAPNTFNRYAPSDGTTPDYNNKRKKKNNNRNGPVGKFTVFNMFKENLETMNAIHRISSLLKVDNRCLSFAGTKDRRGITVQKVCAQKLPIERLYNINRVLSNVKVSDAKYVNEPLRLGDLAGNRFCITLRNVDGDPELIERSLTHLKQYGFINYFGMQRFGTSETVSTHQIGLCLLRKQWKEAVDLILQHKDIDDEETKEAKRLYLEENKTAEALAKMPRRQTAERRMLEFIQRHGLKDPLGVINSIPWSIRLMYVHAYQSYIWNHVVSQRISKFGGKSIIVGDLVLAPGAKEDPNNSLPPVIRVESVEEAAKYGMEDLVLPTPGFLADYPENEIKQVYVDLLAKDSLTLESFRSNVKLTNLPGTYRKVIIKPIELIWKSQRYDDETIALTLSDQDKLNNVQLAEPVEDGRFMAVVLEFTLPTSCYATMLLRELMKMGTTSAYQKTLNVTGSSGPIEVDDSLEVEPES